jgi:hypothetical protein
MFDIPSHQGNASQNYTEISSHPNQNGYHQKSKQRQMLGRMQGEKKLLYTVGGNVKLV